MSNMQEQFKAQKESQDRTGTAIASILGILDGLDAAEQKTVLTAVAAASGREITMTSQEKKAAGWYNEHRAFGDRSVDC